jgi:hypothetical protein
MANQAEVGVCPLDQFEADEFTLGEDTERRDTARERVEFAEDMLHAALLTGQPRSLEQIIAANAQLRDPIGRVVGKTETIRCFNEGCFRVDLRILKNRRIAVVGTCALTISVVHLRWQRETLQYETDICEVRLWKVDESGATLVRYEWRPTRRCSSQGEGAFDEENRQRRIDCRLLLGDWARQRDRFVHSLDPAGCTRGGHRGEVQACPASIRELLVAEQAAGNRIAMDYSGWPKESSVYYRMEKPLQRAQLATQTIRYRSVRTRRGFKEEYEDLVTGDVIAFIGQD